MQRQKYLEIYPSEVAARKIRRHLEKMAEVRPRVYRKTLLRYKKLAYLLLDCVTRIVRMLQSEMLLSSADTEFQELASDFDTEQIDELKTSIDALEVLVDKKPTTESKNLASDTLKQYRSVFSQAARNDFGYVEVNECAEMLNYWLTRRFSGFNPNFKYQITQLPVWATFIIIAYGKYHHDGQSKQFIADFKKWCDELNSDKDNCWALPYNIFNMSKTVIPGNMTLNAVVIYDILMNGVLYQLIDVKVPMDSAYIAKLVKEYRPEYHRDVQTRFVRQQELIAAINLHLVSDVKEEVGS